MRLPRPLSRGATAVVGALVVLGAGGAVAATQLASSPSGAQRTTSAQQPIPAPTVHLAGARHGRLPWRHHVDVVVEHGTLSSVTVTDDTGEDVPGSYGTSKSTWSSDAHLVPGVRYTVQVALTGDDGRALSRTLHVRAGDSRKHLTALLSPGDGDVVGVGSPVVVTFSRPVPDADRAAVEQRLSVSTSPEVIGAWHWMSAQEVHWRPPTYWRPGTHVRVRSDLDRLYFGSGVWGTGTHVTSFRIGDAHISRVDVARHEMYVYDNGRLIRTMPISAGRDKYPTKDGVHITFEKSPVVTMDSATVGIPRNSPDGYYEKVYWDVRISYGGAFVHAAPWSVADQGSTNVSHGCVNLSTDNAKWFYDFSQRGDVVDVYNSTAAPVLTDPGMADWNLSWREWLAGSAAPSPAAAHLHPPMPRAVEPAAPAAAPVAEPSTAASSAATSPSPSPSPTATRHSHHHHGQR